jgi:ligand-binding SRPBCC domain-containing protein
LKSDILSIKQDPGTYNKGGNMAQITRSIHINAPLSKVFDYVTNPENWTRYVTSLVDVRNVSNEIPSAGTTFEWTYSGEFEKDKKFTMEMEGSFPIKETFNFQGDTTSTELNFEIHYDVPGKVLGVIANKLVIERLNVKEADVVLNKVKDICESV